MLLKLLGLLQFGANFYGVMWVIFCISKLFYCKIIKFKNQKNKYKSKTQRKRINSWIMLNLYTLYTVFINFTLSTCY